MDVYWWDSSVPIDYLEIRNGTYADGKPMSTRMGGSLLSGIVTFYSHVGQSLEVMVSTASWDHSLGDVYLHATYTVISYNDTVSNGKHTQEKLHNQYNIFPKWPPFIHSFVFIQISP